MCRGEIESSWGSKQCPLQPDRATGEAYIRDPIYRYDKDHERQEEAQRPSERAGTEVFYSKGGSKVCENLFKRTMSRLISLIELS